MGPCSICICLSPSLFYLIKTDSLQLAQSFHLLCAWKITHAHTQTCFDKLRQKQFTRIVLSVDSTHSAKCVSTCTLDYCLSLVTLSFSLTLCYFVQSRLPPVFGLISGLCLFVLSHISCLYEGGGPMLLSMADLLNNTCWELSCKGCIVAHCDCFFESVCHVCVCTTGWCTLWYF